jgi:catechol 2,3-dioxygenase-like lactoylglutathione lyase family enzyme
MKIPKAQYDATVAFYRDTLGLAVTKEDASDTPTVEATHKVEFGPITLWLDRDDTYSQTDLWLQVHTDELDTATTRLAETGITPCDELEPFDGVEFRSHWIKNPAGVVHLLAGRLTPAAAESDG